MRRSGRRSSLLAALLLTTSLVVTRRLGLPGLRRLRTGEGDAHGRRAPARGRRCLYIAQKHGLFEAEGIKVRIKPVQQSIQALPALAKGDVDVISAANYVTFLQAHDKGTL